MNITIAALLAILAMSCSYSLAMHCYEEANIEDVEIKDRKVCNTSDQSEIQRAANKVTSWGEDALDMFGIKKKPKGTESPNCFRVLAKGLVKAAARGCDVTIFNMCRHRNIKNNCTTMKLPDALKAVKVIPEELFKQKVQLCCCDTNKCNIDAAAALHTPSAVAGLATAALLLRHWWL